MGRLKANYNSSKNNKISIKKQNLGGGRLLLNYIFDPKEIQGLSLWLKADAGVTLSGSDVTAWADQSGNGRNGIGAGSPILINNELNGKPVIAFNGTSARITGPEPTTSLPVTLIIVAKPLGEEEVGTMYQQYSDVDNMSFYRWNGGLLRIYNGVDLTGATSVPSSFQIFSNAINGVNSEIYINGRLDSSGDSGNLTPSGNYHLAHWVGGDTYTNMQIAEVIVYNRVLTTPERQQVEAYLREKYAITCGYRNTNKLVQTAGNNAPIGANFDNIAFNYSSFASNCSALGLDPATILNDLGGVDFSSNYVVIRAKTTSSINSDRILDLGDGIISITNIGFVSPAGNKYYRFFVMCKDGWNTVRFYGVNYPI